MGGTITPPSDRQVISDLRQENTALRRILEQLARARTVKDLKAAQKEAQEEINGPVRQSKSIYWNRWDTAYEPPRLREVRGKMRVVPQYGGDGLYFLMEGSKKVNECSMTAQDARQRNADRTKNKIKALWHWSGRK